VRRAPRAAVDTIAAVATAPGRGGIGVLRLSGPQAPEIARKILGRLPKPRHATLCTARDARGVVLDQGIALYFPAPHSYTGEDVLEFQGHGGPVVMQILLEALVDAGARLAEPGEYTKRAFLGGRLDLAQAEAVADLIDASSRAAVSSAQRSLSGEFSTAVERLVGGLTELRALTEAMLDFPEEEVDALHRGDAQARLAGLSAALDQVLEKSRQGSLLRSGIHLVIAGRPNVGKSSLMNRLAGEQRAIVTAIPGTTRDALRETIQIEGVPIVLVDTAGLRDARDEVERLGIERTWHELERADVVLVVFDAAAGVGAEDRAWLRKLPPEGHRIHVYNKVDLLPGEQPGARAGEPQQVWLSATTGAGLAELRRAILQAAGWRAAGESVFLARERHLRALARAKAHLETASAQQAQWEFFAEELRLAQEALGEISGRVGADELLGEIFAKFCIGK
jgi:tRNA modification GTPase